MNISQMNISPKNTISFLNLFGVIKDLTNEATIEFDIDGIKILSTDFTFSVHISKDKLIDYVSYTIFALIHHIYYPFLIKQTFLTFSTNIHFLVPDSKKCGYKIQIL